MDTSCDKNDASESGSEDAIVAPEWLLQYLFDLRRDSARTRATWRTTVLQVQAVFLSLCLPLSLANSPKGIALRLLHLSALCCILALITGTMSLIDESTRAHRLESEVQQRIRDGKSSVAISEPESSRQDGSRSCMTPVFVLFSLASLVLLYFSMAFRS